MRSHPVFIYVALRMIRSSGQNVRFYVYLPMPLAAALGIERGEEVSWELLDRSELHLVRASPPPVRAKKRKCGGAPGGGQTFSAESNVKIRPLYPQRGLSADFGACYFSCVCRVKCLMSKYDPYTHNPITQA